MHQHAAPSTPPPFGVSAFRRKALLISLLVLVVSLAGLWLMRSRLPPDLSGRWDRDAGGYVMLRFTEAGVRIHQPANCDGWPLRHMQDTFAIVVSPGELFFPESLARQRYQLVTSRWSLAPDARRLVIDDVGPIPPGSYTYNSPNLVGADGRTVFEDIGLCGLAPRQ